MKVWTSAIGEIPECRQKRDLLRTCGAYLATCSEKFVNAIPDGIPHGMTDAFLDAKAKASGIQEQEQEQEQEPPISPKGGRPSPKRNPYRSEATAVIEQINRLSGKAYNPDSNVVIKYLVARLKEGVSLGDCLLVVTDRWASWKDKPKMIEHFNPKTLFRPQNFEGYPTEARPRQQENESRRRKAYPA